MENILTLKEKILSGEYDEVFNKVYVDASLLEYQKNRYVKSIEKYMDKYTNENIEIYSTPGRSEVCGNHTDHQNGKVLATSINLDAIAIVSTSQEDEICILSEGYDEIRVSAKNLSYVKEEQDTSIALVKGILNYLVAKGYEVHGFNMYTTSDVLVGAGMSSSAAFEVLIGTVVSGLFNNMEIDPVVIAKAAQYAENVYFGKPCGLMDQMACSVGGLIYVDFLNPKEPYINKIHTDFAKEGYSLCLVDTLGSHANLTDEYAAIPVEMKEISSYFKENNLRSVDENDFYASIPAMRGKVSDRAILRAIHFYQEESRVDLAVCALENEDFSQFFKVIKESGDSSYKYLQNVYSVKDLSNQNISIALAVSEKYIKGDGAMRIHGGGFAGTMQVFIQNEYVEEYKKSIETIFGKDTCHVLKIRNYGGMKIIF